MPITVSSAKAKGRRLQQWVVAQLYRIFPMLEEGDARSTSMGASGEDVQLSPAARRLFKYSVECKSLAKIAVYSLYEQAVSNAGKYEPLLIIKANGKKPLAVVDASHFLELTRGNNGKN